MQRGANIGAEELRIGRRPRDPRGRQPKQDRSAFKRYHRRGIPPRRSGTWISWRAGRRRIVLIQSGMAFSSQGAETEGRRGCRSPARSASRRIPCWSIFGSCRVTRIATPKMTIPSPSVLHFRGGRGDQRAGLSKLGCVLSPIWALPIRKAVRAFADAGCRYLQLDDTNLAYLCDAEQRKCCGSRATIRTSLPALRRHDQRRHRQPASGHDHLHASVPRQFPHLLDRAGRL